MVALQSRGAGQHSKPCPGTGHGRAAWGCYWEHWWDWSSTEPPCLAATPARSLVRAGQRGAREAPTSRGRLGAAHSQPVESAPRPAEPTGYHGPVIPHGSQGASNLVLPSRGSGTRVQPHPFLHSRSFFVVTRFL